MRKLTGLALVFFLHAAFVQAQEKFPYCQILDGTEAPAWTVSAGYAESAALEAPKGRDVAVATLQGGGGLYYWRTGAGDVDLSGAYDLWFFDGSGGIGLPDQVGALRINAAYVSRNEKASAVQVNVYPGFYSDFEDLSFKDVALPFQVLGIQAFNPQMSGLIGLAVYPGFDRSFDPRFGVRVAPVAPLRIDLMYPETRITYRPDEQEFYAGIRHDAVNEFRLADGDERRRFAIRETRLYAGASWPATGALRVVVEAGYLFNREVDFDRVESGHDWGEALYVRVGLGGSI